VIALKRGVFERRGREGFAEDAKEEIKKRKRKNQQDKNQLHFKKQLNSVSFGILLQSLRILRALCVQKIPIPIFA
jgi:hypothetical protein